MRVFRTLCLGAVLGCASETPTPLSAPVLAEARCAEELETPVSLIGVGSETRQAIVRAAERGLVAVRYQGEGCRRALEVLPACRHPARYVFDPLHEKATRVMRNPREVRRGLSLASEQLLAYVEGARGVRADVLSVGRLTAPPRFRLRRDILRGERCAAATHIVREMRLGGFALTAGSIVELERASSQFSEPPTSNGAIRELGRTGDAPACARVRKTATRQSGCDVPVTVDLVPLAPAREEFPSMVRVRGGRVGNKVVRPFAIDRTEVTAADYQRCVAARVCKPAGRGRLCTTGIPGRERHPVNCVSYRQAERFCAFVKKRLPTGLEWALAAGAGSNRRFTWGDAWPPPEGAGNLADETTAQLRPHWAHVTGYMDGFATTAPVGGLPAAQSVLPIADMAGNVQEWVDATGPRGSRVVRGGSFGHGRAEQLEVSRRVFYVPSHTSAHVGFRCARSTRRDQAVSPRRTSSEGT